MHANHRLNHNQEHANTPNKSIAGGRFLLIKPLAATLRVLLMLLSGSAVGASAADPCHYPNQVKLGLRCFFVSVSSSH